MIPTCYEPTASLWRAGLPCVGLRSSPKIELLQIHLDGEFSQVSREGRSFLFVSEKSAHEAEFSKVRLPV